MTLQIVLLEIGSLHLTAAIVIFQSDNCSLKEQMMHILVKVVLQALLLHELEQIYKSSSLDMSLVDVPNNR